MISFEPSEDEQALRETVRRFAAEHIRPHLRVSEDSGVPDQLIRSYWQLGLALMTHPVEIGGAGLDLRALSLVEEELAWGDPGVSAALPRASLAGDVLSALDPQIAARWLSSFNSEAPVFSAAAVFEGEGAVPCRAEATEAGYRLNGKYIDVAAGRAEWILLRAVLEGELALFVLPAGTTGVSFVPHSHRLGLRAAGYGYLDLDGSVISGNCLLARGAVARSALARGLQRDLVTWAARAVGVSRASLEYAAGYATERKAFGKPIAEHQAVAFMIADMGILVEGARSLLWHAAWALDREAPDGPDSALSAAAFAAETAVSVTTDAVQVLGGHGYVQDHPVEKWMRDARCVANVLELTGSSLGSLLTSGQSAEGAEVSA